MQNIETLYSSYQELLLDLDIFGRLVGSQDIDDRDAFKDILFQEYAKSRPIPTLESRDCELSEPVSEDFHVSYMHELELSQNEVVINWDDEDDDNDVVGEGIDLSSFDTKEIPENFPHELMNPILEEDRDRILSENDYFNTRDTVDNFSGSVEELVSNFGSIQSSEESYFEGYGEDDDIIYSDDEDSSDEDIDYSDEEDISYDDDISYEDDLEQEDSYDNSSTDDYDSEYVEDEDIYYDDEVYEEDELFEADVGSNEVYEDGISETSESDEEFYDEIQDDFTEVSEIVVEPPPIVLPKISEPEKTEGTKEDIPSDILQYLRLHPRCEISEVLKYYPRKDLERYIRIGKVIKKGSKVYI